MKKQSYGNVQFVNRLIFDFHKLAFLQPQLRPYVLILNGRTVCNFKDQVSLIILTKAILKHCFSLNWSCPSQNLCPRIPARLNYLLFLQLQLVQVQIKKVLDVGTGATLIYPLLGWSVFGWRFIATEICRQSYQSSRKIIEMNRLEREINLRLIKYCKRQKEEQFYGEDSIITEWIDKSQEIDLVVCNPPFFEQSFSTVTAMTEEQHHTEGGEYSFFFNLYRQSFSMSNIKFFSCLIGLRSNFLDIKQLLILEFEEGYLSYIKFGEMLQGNNTRFVVMWRVKSELIEKALRG